MSNKLKYFAAPNPKSSNKTFSLDDFNFDQCHSLEPRSREPKCDKSLLKGLNNVNEIFNADLAYNLSSTKKITFYID